MTQPTRIYKHSSAGTDWAALLLGGGLGLTLALQLTTVRKSDFMTVYANIVSLSRLLALVGTYFALIGILLVARIPWVERGVGHDRLVTWHRKLGPWSLYAIGAHVLLVIISFAGQDSIPLYKELWEILQTFDWMWFALSGFVLMIFAGVTSYKKARAKMSYETWWLVHMYTYFAMAAAFMHQILNGQMFIGHPLNRAYWISLYVFVAFSIIYWRFGVPLVRSMKVNLKIEKVVIEGPGVISVIMKGRNLHKLGAQGGQFFGWRFLARGHFLMSHPYSLSAAPTEHFMRITVKDLGDHSRYLAFLKPGTRVFVEGPYGAFTAGRSTRPHVVLVGGGVGITPVRALIDEFNGGVQMDLIYRASRQEDLVLREELDYLAFNSGGSIRIHYLVGSRTEHPMDADSLTALVPQFADSDIYICGPQALVSAVRKAAEDSGVPKNRFHDESFSFS
ncbi:MAG: ferredoxin reductase family protein [Candidatus Planktophila sp.]|nr:ferredoxin reductase family protein [Candidatus Planktophila sp.]